MWLLTAISGVLFLQGVLGFPSGAPNRACPQMTPIHRGQTPQTSTPPYSIQVNQNSYSINGRITVTISGCGTQLFQGFLLQARRVDVNSDRIAPVGFFNIPIGARVISGCGLFGQAVTHQDGNNKQSITFEWTAPEQSEGDIAFYATFLESYTTFWVKLRSSVIQDETIGARSDVGSEVYPSPSLCPAVPLPDPTRVTTQPPTAPPQTERPTTQPSTTRTTPIPVRVPSSSPRTEIQGTRITTTISRTLPFLTTTTTRRPTQAQTTSTVATTPFGKNKSEGDYVNSTVSVWYPSHFTALVLTIFSIIGLCVC